jgi:hypothetical protein
MNGSTKLVVTNPLALSSSQVAGTRALGIIIEPEPVIAEGEAPEESAAAVLAVDDAEATATTVEDIEAEPLMTQAESIDTSVESPEGIERQAADMAEGPRDGMEDGAVHTEAPCEGAKQVFEQASHRMKAALDEAGTGATKLTLKLVEFARANTQNGLDLACDYASVRSVPDALNVQAAYVRRQFALLTAQAEELRRLTTELTEKTKPSQDC